MKPRYRYVGTQVLGWVSPGIGHGKQVVKRLTYQDVDTGKMTYVKQFSPSGLNKHR